MITTAKLRQSCNIMDKLRFHQVLFAFVLIFLQKNAQGIKCLQCFNCTHTGGAENSTCVTDGGFCISTIVREKGEGKDVIVVTRRCMSKDQSTLCYKQNIRCCRDHDLCNNEIPELDSGYSITTRITIIVVPIIIFTLVACIFLCVMERHGAQDQNINTNLLMGSQPLSLKVPLNRSQPGSGSASSGDGTAGERFLQKSSFYYFYL